ncbi:MAG: hypothetical protein ABSC08_07915 [Bryobacteraceae bacterium]|jgi:uncharacterized protein (TIGR03437 family)
MEYLVPIRSAGPVLRLAIAAGLLAHCVLGQAPATAGKPDWRRVGTLTLAEGRPSPSAGGPVERVAFLADGGLVAGLPGGRFWRTADGEAWTAADTAPQPEPLAGAVRLPESGALVRESRRGPALLYAGGEQVWRSGDGGRTWSNLTQLRAGSLLGARVDDLAVDPENPDRVAVAAATGVWISQDGGLSWQGWNENLPAFRAARILAAPARGRGLQVALAGAAGTRVVEWAPGFRLGWLPIEGADKDELLRGAYGRILGTRLSAAAEGGGALYAGSEDGRLWASLDGGQSWRPASSSNALSEVLRIATDPQDGRFAVAALAGSEGKGVRVLRTLDGGASWDDLTADLPEGRVNGLAFDRPTGALYAATDRGVFLSYQGLRAPEPAARWQALTGLPEAPSIDVRLDEPGVRVLASVEGFGVFESPAPHRVRQPLLLHAADYGQRPAAPGALLTIAGSRAEMVTANSLPGVVLSATPIESQIQLPFDVAGDSVRITAQRAGAAALSFGLPLRQVAPAILVDGDGFPVVIDGDSGSQVDALNPVRPGARLQVLATGLGRVRPDWPAGMPAPADRPPAVVAAMRVLVDGLPAHLTRAVLAPGYVGFYLVEFDAPDFLNAGVAEITVEAAGQLSNPVRVYTVPE